MAHLRQVESQACQLSGDTSRTLRSTRLSCAVRKVSALAAAMFGRRMACGRCWHGYKSLPAKTRMSQSLWFQLSRSPRSRGSWVKVKVSKDVSQQFHLFRLKVKRMTALLHMSATSEMFCGVSLGQWWVVPRISPGIFACSKGYDGLPISTAVARHQAELSCNRTFVAGRASVARTIGRYTGETITAATTTKVWNQNQPTL